MENRGLKINRKKTVYLRFSGDGNLGGNSDINLQRQNLERVNTDKYQGATLADNGDLDGEMMHRIQSGWNNWKRVSGILCDRRISLRGKGKVCKTSNYVRYRDVKHKRRIWMWREWRPQAGQKQE